MAKSNEYSIVLLPNTEDKKQLSSIKINHPKTDKLITILFDDNYNLFEIQKFSPILSSWLVDKFIIKDGSLFVITKIDPIFLFLKKLNEARFRNSKSESGNFEDIEEIKNFCLPDDFKQSTKILNNLKLVCDEKVIPGMESSFLRLNETKVLKWLSIKVNKLKANGAYSINDSIEIVSEYLNDSWTTKLYKHLNAEPIKREIKEVTEHKDSRHSKRQPSKPIAAPPTKKTKIQEKPKGMKALQNYFQVKPKPKIE